MKSQRASSLGSLIMPMLALMSSGRSSRMTSGQTLCSTTWYVYSQVNVTLLVAYKFPKLPLSTTSRHLLTLCIYLSFIFVWMLQSLYLEKCIPSTRAGNSISLV